MVHWSQWVAADGTTTNLGESFNGLLKKMGSELSMWKGRVVDSELEVRWHELAWRINSELNTSVVSVGAKLVKYVAVLAEYQASTQGRLPAVVPEARRALEMSQISIPQGEHRVRRFPAKKSVLLRACWRKLREWLRGDDDALELQGLSKQERYYCHRWCECWVGINHSSTGP